MSFPPFSIRFRAYVYAYILYNMSRASVKRRNKKLLRSTKKSGRIICTHYKFYNFPNIFYSLFPSPNTYRPCNRAWFRRRNRGISLRLNTISQARRISFRIVGIGIVKTAFFHLALYLAYV